MQAEANAAARSTAPRGRIDRALQSSSSAEGQTGATQAGNQLLGETATQLMEIRALMIAQGRAVEVERMERLARDARAVETSVAPFQQSGKAWRQARTAFDRE